MVDGKRTLYRVYVVDPRKSGKVLGQELVVADSEEQALLKAGIVKIAGDAGLDIEQVDTYVEDIAAFIRPRPHTQKVRVAKEEDED